MTAEYVCASCRRQLLAKLPRRTLARTTFRSVSFTSFNGAGPAFRQNTQPERDGAPGEKTSRQPDRDIPYHEPLRSVEDDFLDRILGSRKTSDGPYSQPRRPRRESAGIIKNSGVSSSQPGPLKQSAVVTVTGRHQSAEVSTRPPASYALPALRLLPSSVLPSQSNHPVRGTVFSDIVPSRARRSTVNTTADGHQGAASLDASRAQLDSNIRGSVQGKTSIAREERGNSDPPVAETDTNPPVKAKDAKPTVSAELSRALGKHTFIAGSKAGKDPSCDISTLIGKIRNPDETLVASWRTFLEISHMGSLRELNPDAFTRNILIGKFASQWACEPLGQLQLTPSSVFRRFDRHGLKFRSHHWTHALSRVHSSIIQHLMRHPGTNGMPDLLNLCQEMISLWDYFISKYGKPAEASKIVTWESLINSAEMLQVRTWFSKDFKARLYHFLSTTSRVHPDLDFAALTSFAIVHQVLKDQSLQQMGSIFEPFDRFLRQLLTHSAAKSRYCESRVWSDAFKTASPLEVDLVVDSLRTLLSSTVPPAFTAPPTKAPSSHKMRSPNHATTTEEYYKKRVGRATAKRDFRLLESLWAEVTSTSFASDEPNMRAELYVDFIRGFLTMRRPQRAVDIWNELLNAGIIPTLKMWDTMLRGFGNLRDAKGVDQIWRMMLDSGIEPDGLLFTSRIQALGNGGWWRQAMEAFDDMVHKWLRAVKTKHPAISSMELASLGDCERIPKPTVQALNGLIPALVRARKHQELSTRISWARSIGVKPDAYSFNPMLKQALKENDFPRVDELFDQMQDQGIQPDVATFTILMQSLFLDREVELPVTEGVGAPADLSARQEEVSKLLETMDSHGLQANTWTFSAIIDGLLKSDNHSSTSNLRAASSVVSFMARKKINLSSQIYTSFIMHHFSQQPPELAAIEDLWLRARMDQAVVLDTVFFDRLIEGFAGCSQIGNMKMALEQAERRGRAPGWIALTRAISALAATGDLSGAEDLVARVRKDSQTNEAFRARMGKGWFIETLEQLGLDSAGIGNAQSAGAASQM